MAWIGHTLAEPFDLMRTTMPQNQPRSLSAQADAEILAYILRKNGAPAGKHQLMNDRALASMTIRLEKGWPRGRTATIWPVKIRAMARLCFVS